MNESNRKAKNKYRKKIEELRVELYPTDADIKDRIAERMAAGEKKASYIKRLIREDIERQNFQNTVAEAYGQPIDELLQGGG